MSARTTQEKAVDSTIARPTTSVLVMVPEVSAQPGVTRAPTGRAATPAT